jgi:hypothetical protein
LRPTLHPNLLRPLRESGDADLPYGIVAAVFMSTPTRRMHSPCCARKPRAGHPAAAPPRLENAGVAVRREIAAVADQRCAAGVISFHDPAGNRVEAFHGGQIADEGGSGS